MNKKLALRLLKLLTAFESYSFSISEKFMPDYLHDELVTLMDDLESIVLDKPIEKNPHKHDF
jgi:hypothetical protein